MSSDSNARRQYESWVEVWSTDLYRFAYRLCGQADVAEDLVQETFYHAWRSMGSLKDPDRARPWLFQILRYRWSHHVRADTRRPNLNTPLESAPERPNERPFTPLADMARRESLQRALDALDERYRLPTLMVLMQGMTCREAAEELDVPLGTVLSRIHRARKVLRQHLDDDEGQREQTDGPQEQEADNARRGAAQSPNLRLSGGA